MTRKRSAAGLKSTETVTPVGSFSEIWLFSAHLPLAASIVTISPSVVTP